MRGLPLRRVHYQDWISDDAGLYRQIGRQTVRGGIWAVGANASIAVVQLATTTVLARLLLPADFGLVALAGAISVFVVVFADLGTAQAVIQQRALTQNMISGLFLVNVLAGLVAMGFLMLGAPLAADMFSDERLSAIIIVTSVTAPILALSRTHHGLLQRRMQWRKLQTIAIVAQILAAAVAIAIALLTDWGYWALVSQALVSAALTTMLSWLACSWRPTLVTNWKETWGPIAFGFHLSVFSLLNAVHRQSDDLLIGWRWGAADLGQYGRAYTLLRAPLQLINGPIGSAVVPALSRLQDEPERWRNVYLDALVPVTLISSYLGAVLFAGSEQAIAVLFGPGWELAGTIMGYFSIAMIIAGASNSSGWIFLSLGRTKEMARWGVFSTLMILVAFLVGLPYGATGVAIAFAAKSAILTIPCLGYAARYGPITIGAILGVAAPLTTIGILAGIGGRIAGASTPGLGNFWQLGLASIAASFFFAVGIAIWMWLAPETRNRLRNASGKFTDIIKPGQNPEDRV